MPDNLLAVDYNLALEDTYSHGGVSQQYQAGRWLLEANPEGHLRWQWPAARLYSQGLSRQVHRSREDHKDFLLSVTMHATKPFDRVSAGPVATTESCLGQGMLTT